MRRSVITMSFLPILSFRSAGYSWHFPIYYVVPLLSAALVLAHIYNTVGACNTCNIVRVTCNIICHIYIYAYIIYCVYPSWSYEAWERLSMEHRYCVLHSEFLCRTEEAAWCPTWARDIIWGFSLVFGWENEVGGRAEYRNSEGSLNSAWTPKKWLHFQRMNNKHITRESPFAHDNYDEQIELSFYGK